MLHLAVLNEQNVNERIDAAERVDWPVIVRIDPANLDELRAVALRDDFAARLGKPGRWTFDVFVYTWCWSIH